VARAARGVRQSCGEAGSRGAGRRRTTSTPITRASGLCGGNAFVGEERLSPRATPVSVPPVPAAAKKASTLPDVGRDARWASASTASMSSRAVPSSWQSGLFGWCARETRSGQRSTREHGWRTLAYWSRITACGMDCCRRFAIAVNVFILSRGRDGMRGRAPTGVRQVRVGGDSGRRADNLGAEHAHRRLLLLCTIHMFNSCGGGEKIRAHRGRLLGRDDDDGVSLRLVSSAPNPPSLLLEPVIATAFASKRAP
jgi:hypothetical protein